MVELGEAINTILKIENTSISDLNKHKIKRKRIYRLMFIDKAKEFKAKYGITVSPDTYAGLRKFFE